MENCLVLPNYNNIAIRMLRVYLSSYDTDTIAHIVRRSCIL